jgi:hypothetical protein
MIIWGIVRAYDERWLLGEQSHSGSLGVQLAGLALTVAGVVLLWRVQRKHRRHIDSRHSVIGGATRTD